MNSTLGVHLLELIHARRIRAAVIGLGYVGLPIAVEFARGGVRAVGIDIDAGKVEAVNAGISYVPDVAGVDVSRLQQAGMLSATTDFSILRDCDTVNICVPTPLRKTKDPDLSFVISAVEKVREFLHPGMLVVLESTTYPGTTEELVQTMLEENGLKAGQDFFLAFSPERVDPGNPTYGIRNVPKVVGGLTSDCTAVASALYQTAVSKIIPVSTPRVAEMVKLLENTFRAVNIGLVNELAQMCDRLGIDVWEVIQAAATKPFGFMPFYPGPGLGGHCIPIDPFYLSWKAKASGFEPRFIELAGHVNAAMPHVVADLVADALNSRGKPVRGASILVAGVTYKKDIDDIRESPALDVMALLERRGANLSYADPYVPSLAASAWAGVSELSSTKLTPSTLRDADCVVVLADHSAFDFALLCEHADLVVDTRNALAGLCGTATIFTLGAGSRAIRQEEAVLA
jgi:UDP-N-acetyl-D-glucosamine dehydrogenase